jgi:hypothetical protein
MDNQKPSEAAERVVSDLQKDFKIVGTHRVHSWYAWAIVGIVFGMALGIVYVANRSGSDFVASQAAQCPIKKDGSTDPLKAEGQATLFVEKENELAYFYALTGESDPSVTQKVLDDIRDVKAAAVNDCQAKQGKAVEAADAKCAPIPQECAKSAACKDDTDRNIGACTEARCTKNGTEIKCKSAINNSYVTCRCITKAGQVADPRRDDGGRTPPTRPREY